MSSAKSCFITCSRSTVCWRHNCFLTHSRELLNCFRGIIHHCPSPRLAHRSYSPSPITPSRSRCPFRSSTCKVRNKPTRLTGPHRADKRRRTCRTHSCSTSIHTCSKSFCYSSLLSSLKGLKLHGLQNIFLYSSYSCLASCYLSY